MASGRLAPRGEFFRRGPAGGADIDLKRWRLEDVESPTHDGVMRELSAAAMDCPLAPPDQSSVYSRALHRACLVLGGIAELAKRLEVVETDLRLWIRGEVLPPEQVFLEAVEVILLHVGGNGRLN